MKLILAATLFTTIVTARGDDFTAKFCLKCHGDNPANLKADLDLRGTFSEKNQPLLRDIIRQIDTEEMPTKAPFPTRAERDTFLQKIRPLLREKPKPELRRLTRDEYANTLRDLLGVDLQLAQLLPADGQGPSGFSNDRETLTVSTEQLNRHFQTAERALDAAFELARDNAKITTFLTQKMQPSVPGVKPHADGIMVVQPSHAISTEIDFPVDGHYEFTIDAAVFGEPCVAQFSVAGVVVAEVKITADNVKFPERKSATGFVRRGRHPVKITSKNLVPQIPEPPAFTEKMAERGRQNAATIRFLRDADFPTEPLRRKLASIQESAEFLAFLGPNADPRKIDLHRKYFHERTADFKKLTADLGADFTQKFEAENRKRLAENADTLAAVAHVKWTDWEKFQGKLYLEKFSVIGPLRPAPTTDDWNLIDALKRDITPTDLISQFAGQALRRPVTDAELAPHIRTILDAQRRDEDRARAVKLALAAILVSPDFLHRRDNPATELSYFLWLSQPDAPLRETDFSDPAAVAKQIDRLIADPRSDAFFAAFANDWLELAELNPDRNLWPEFSPEIADAMRAETKNFLADLFRKNRPVRDLLLASENFASPALANFYQKTKRIGLLENGAVLVATSSPTRTNPVRRGRWIWENLLGQKVGEPLPDAGELPGDAGAPRGKTLREELAAHRDQPACIRCHEKIDPLGFALENFDATGRWRAFEAGKPVDASGEFFGGGNFSDIREFRTVLLEKHGDSLAQNLALRLRAFLRGQENEPGVKFPEIDSDSGMLDVLKQVVIE